MDREKRIIDSYSQIPEAEIVDYWEEDSEYIIYRIKDWFKKIWRFFESRFLKFKKYLEIF